ncbi:FadR/GntR family transcriptional regulator [Niabella beijingensis]|uniref:FadR/GntR family transcriptional regulator n=1 Tax=Niabella beijingensis TaxID=2872700 RepID=UPI001CBB6293|nr:FCD domain-containing protein [Niabella beijingensis]MBZ4192460.1 GntR family transcriptional regulator [Niabella beijingensis]
MATELTPINKKSMAEHVEFSLQKYLRENNFKIGDALPTELELANRLGVSRNVVREALSKFKMMGIIESKKKVGMVVSNPDFVGTMEKLLHPTIMDDSTLQDLFELRLVLEMGIAELLFARITRQDIKELEEIVEKEEKTTEKGPFRIKNEIAFHGKLYDITGNTTLRKFQLLLLPVFEYVIKLEGDQLISGAVNHKGLIQILKKGTIEDFKKGMVSHLQPHFDRIKK